MFEVILLVGGVILFFMVLRQGGRIDRLERALKEKGIETHTKAETIIHPARTDHHEERREEHTREPGLVERFSSWAREDWLLKLGALLLLIGFGWLATYAFINNWIGPMGRIALGIIGGAIVMIVGAWRIKEYVHQGGIFVALGSTVILLTIFAAREIYQFFTPVSALGIMFLTTVVVTLIAVRYNAKSLALTGLILAAIAPLFTNSPDPNFTSLFLYLLVVTIGTVWVVTITGWRELTAAALIIVSAFSLPHLFDSTSADLSILLLFAYAFSIIFFITNTFGVLKLEGKKILPDVITAVGNGAFILTWLIVAAPEEWKSLIMVAWMIIFGVAAFIVFRITRRHEPFYAYAGVGVALLGAATADLLNGAQLTIAYIIEAGILAVLTYTFLRNARVTSIVSFAFIVPIVMSLGSMDLRVWNNRVLHEDFFVLLVMTIVGLGIGVFLWNMSRGEDKDISKLTVVYMAVGSIYGYILIWLALHSGIPEGFTATMTALVIYTIIGLITYFYGRINDSKVYLVYGSLLLGFVVLRLLFVDVWRMKEIVGRIITFFAIGALLISTAFIGRKKSE